MVTRFSRLNTFEKSNSRKCDDDEVEPVPGVPQVGEGGEDEAAAHDLGGRLEGVDGGEDDPGERV